MDNKTKNLDKKNQLKCEVDEKGEDASKYGEFISSYFAWISLKEQKERVEKLQNITREKNEKNNKKGRKNEKII
jgi:hypothetical protein